MRIVIIMCCPHIAVLRTLHQFCAHMFDIVSTLMRLPHQIMLMSSVDPGCTEMTALCAPCCFWTAATTCITVPILAKIGNQTYDLAGN